MTSKKICIFCNQNRKLSKEHIWPEWLRHRITKNNNDKYLNKVLSGEANQPMTIEKSEEQNGNLITLKFRVVCKVCNNGWMSELEELVQPFFEQALTGNINDVNEKTQQYLAEWIAMKIMVAEQSDGKTMVTTSEDLYQFYSGRIIPSYYRVYIGKHDLDVSSEYLRHSCTLASNTSGPKKPLAGLNRNTQSIAIIFGKVLIYVIACREDDIKLWNFLKLNELKLIYPSKSHIIWKTVKTIRKKRVSEIALGLQNLVTSEKVRYGGNQSFK